MLRSWLHGVPTYILPGYTAWREMGCTKLTSKCVSNDGLIVRSSVELAVRRRISAAGNIVDAVGPNWCVSIYNIQSSFSSSSSSSPIYFFYQLLKKVCRLPRAIFLVSGTHCYAAEYTKYEIILGIKRAAAQANLEEEEEEAEDEDDSISPQFFPAYMCRGGVFAVTNIRLLWSCTYAMLSIFLLSNKSKFGEERGEKCPN